MISFVVNDPISSLRQLRVLASWREIQGEFMCVSRKVAKSLGKDAKEEL